MGRRIRTKPQVANPNLPAPFRIGGWFSGRSTYLWFGEADTTDERGMTRYGRCYATLGGQPLYRLAKAIVRQFEEGDNTA